MGALTLESVTFLFTKNGATYRVVYDQKPNIWTVYKNGTAVGSWEYKHKKWANKTRALRLVKSVIKQENESTDNR